MLKILKNNKGEIYIETVVLIIVAMMLLAFAIKLLPIYVAKQNLDTYATELIREATIVGEIGTATSIRQSQLNEDTGITPKVSWSSTGRIDLNEEVTVYLTYQANIGFGPFSSIPITLHAQASGKGEVYWK